jgi:hypothetical protein
MNDPWWRTTIRILFWFVTRLFLPVVAIATPAVAAYGALHPRAADIAALQLGRNEIALFIGRAGDSECGPNGATPCAPVLRRTYLIAPRMDVSAVSEVAGSISVTTGRGGGFEVLAIWLIGVWCAWHYWFRGMASNYRLERP